MDLRVALVLLLAGCGTGGRGDEAGAPGAREAVRSAVQTATLTGLYEGDGPSQLCIVDRGTGNARFALVVRRSGGLACSGAGTATRHGAQLTLEMNGDEACVVDATIDGRDVRFPAPVASGCAYYCAAGASLAGTRFDKTGGAAEDALRARDLVGDPLCAGMGVP